ncbi:MAG: EscU/YscU/HrcU family type III secretion system export apparatus switch protein [Syntrophaceae bacterium]
MDKKPKLAAAIQYDPQKHAAPIVAARGSGAIAEKIISVAKKHNIPVREDAALVQVLSRLDLDTQIPVELYRAVAEVLAFVYSLNERQRQA